MQYDGVTFSINDDLHILDFRFSGVVTGESLRAAAAEAYSLVDRLDLYDHIFDLRRAVDLVAYEDMVRLASLWRNTCGCHDAETLFALVTVDPLRISRARAYRNVFDGILLEAFPSMIEAVTWLRPSLPGKWLMQAAAGDADEAQVGGTGI